MTTTMTQPVVLVIDDSRDIHDILYVRLKPEDVELHRAMDARDGLAKARDLLPDLILLDIDMPGMSGVEALRGVRAIDPRIPVIMVTGNEDTRVAGDVIRHGAYSYLPKPVRFQYLEHIAATVLGPAA